MDSDSELPIGKPDLIRVRNSKCFLLPAALRPCRPPSSARSARERNNKERKDVAMRVKADNGRRSGGDWQR